MRVVLVGGGKVGSYLARELDEGGHVVTVIEASPEHAEEISEESRVLVIEGDGTDVGLLTSADVHRADRFVAVTGLDEVNLVACQLALTLGAGQVLARLNNPLNRPTFDALDIPVVAVTDLIGELISREFEVDAFRQVTLLGRGQIAVFEVDIPTDFKARTVSDARMPAGSLLVTVVSGGEVTVPTSATTIRPGDRVTVVSGIELEGEVQLALGYPRRRR